MRYCKTISAVLISLITITIAAQPILASDELRVGTFSVDITPPLGSPLCDALVVPAAEITDPLFARGLVISGSGDPIVMVAFDWVGIGNSGYDRFRTDVARAVGTSPDRVAIHSLHQHDAPGCDFEAEAILAQHGLSGECFNVVHARQVIDDISSATAKAMKEAKPVSHIGLGKAKIEQVASARRVLGDDGKVRYTRTSSTKSAEARAQPEGTIDPFVQCLSFWDHDTPVAVVSFYATHPMSYYGRGQVSADFMGHARDVRQQELKIPHIHFNGAGGNVTAGKYNDGSPENRSILAGRVAAGMQAAWESTIKSPISDADIDWKVKFVSLPISPLYQDLAAIEAKIDDTKLAIGQRVQQARHLAFARRMESGHKIPVQCLSLGAAKLLFMPGELFVEYQLAAQAMHPDRPVMMAAYGDYGPGYIGLEKSYPQGGYETGPVSRVAPQVENVLMSAMKELLGDD